jgi:hypothetical protein
VERTPFLPIAFYQASRIDGAPAEELTGEMPRLSRAVIELSRLLRSDGVAVRLDSAVAAACGADVSWPSPDGPPAWDLAGGNPPDAAALVTIAEPLTGCIAAVKAELRGDRPVIAVMPGPAALSAALGGAHEAAAGAALRALADAACKAGAEILVIEDDPAGDDGRLKRLAAPIVNTARYYTASVVLSVPRAVPERIADAQLLSVDAFLALPDAAGALPSADRLFDAAARRQMADRLVASPGFLSLDDRAMMGREMPEVLSALAEILKRA